MDYTEFKSGDEPYFAWLKANPQGYVLNTRRGKGDRSAKIHLAKCSHISSLKDSPNGFTMNADIKVTATSIEPLIEYLRVNKTVLPIDLHECKTCHATQGGLVVERAAEEVSTSSGHVEGMQRTVVVNVYERSAEARSACINHHGLACAVCDLVFSERYGEIGDGFIHVHHLRVISRRGGVAYVVDPVRDLVPVCPNCHSMLHRGVDQPRTVEELREIMKRTMARPV